MMVGMYKPLDTTDDSESICLLSDQSGGALCAGLRYNGSSIVTYAQWIKAGVFKIAVASSTEPAESVDQSIDWFRQGVDGSNTITADGTTDAYWSVYKFQPNEVADNDYGDDFRFSPEQNDVVAYIMQHDADADTWTYFEATDAITIQGAVSQIASVAMIVAAASIAAF